MAALTTESIPGKVFKATLRAHLQKLCTALTAKLPRLRIFRLAIRAFHFHFSKKA